MQRMMIVDARMGRGKTSAAIRYMNQHKYEKRFLYITPYLSEVARVRDACGFCEPNSDHLTKSSELKRLIHMRRSIVTTHALFYLLDSDTLELIRNTGYSLVVDEDLTLINKLNLSFNDLELVMAMTTKYEQDENGGAWLSWNTKEYTGVFEGYKALADADSLYTLDSALMHILNPRILLSFDEVIMMTYLFAGQYQKAYLDYFGFQYKIVGIEEDGNGYRFSSEPDAPPPLDYSNLISIVDNKRMNAIGDSRTNLSKAWYARRTADHDDIKTLRRHLSNFFRNMTDGGVDSRIWTTFKTEVPKITASRGRFKNNYLPMNIRATNEYRDATNVAYLVNRFCDPNIVKFFAARGINIDHQQFALAEMLQFIWRSAIRDGKPINLYIPSKRMRQLLLDWIRDMNQGGLF